MAATGTSRAWYCICGHLRGEHGDDHAADGKCGKCGQCDCKRYRPEALPAEALL